MAYEHHGKTRRDSVMFKHFDLTDEEVATHKTLHTKYKAHNDNIPKPGYHSLSRSSFESLSTPSQSKVQLPHFFGDNGLIGAITDTGELLSVMKHVGFEDDGFVYVEAPVAGPNKRLWAFSEILAGRLEGIGLRLQDRSKISQATMAYVHDRWPLVSYEYGSCHVELQTFIKEDIICQQLIAHNTSSEAADLELLLDLRLEARWNWAIHPGFVFGKSGGYSLCLLAGNGAEELVEMSVQVFRDGKMEDIQPISFQKVEDSEGAEQSDTNPHTQPTPQFLISVAAGHSEELTVQYKLQKVTIESTYQVDASPRISTATSELAASPRISIAKVELAASVRPGSASSTDSNLFSSHRSLFVTRTHEGLERKARAMLADEVMPYIDVTASLNVEGAIRGGKWLQSSQIVKIFRRHLENILSIQSVSVHSERTSEPAVAIIRNSLDFNLCPGFTGFNCFRFLLHMYTYLGEGDQTLAEQGLSEYLRKRIYKVCSGQLEWSFNVAASQELQWLQTHSVSGEASLKFSDWSFGVEHVLKLHEYLKVFPNERLRIMGYIATRVSSWLRDLEAHRDAKSKLWPGNKRSVQVSWQNIEYRFDEAVELPKYFLDDQIGVWEALSSTQRILEEGLRDQQDSQGEMSANVTWNEVKSVAAELKTAFPLSNLKNLILERFTDSLPRGPESIVGGNTFILASRCAQYNKRRTQFYYHSPFAFEGFSSGFFNDANGRPSQAWTNTLASQDVKTSKQTWKTSMNLSIRVLLKETCEHFLKETYRTVLRLENPVEQILKLVSSSGMILDREDVDIGTIPYDQCENPHYHPHVVWVLMSACGWRTEQSQKASDFTPSPTSSTLPHSPTFPSKDHQSTHKTTMDGEPYKSAKTQQFGTSDHDTQYATGGSKARNFGGGKNSKEVRSDVNMGNVYEDFPPYWLYPDPDTFSNEETSPILEEEMRSLEQHLSSTYGEIPSILEKGLTEYQQKDTFADYSVNHIALIDIGSRSKGGDGTPQSEIRNFIAPRHLALHSIGPRKRKDAKKRFIYINACSSQEAVVLYLGSPLSERYSTKGFIERYCSGTNWAKDDVFKAANFWVSELHLSFFVLVQPGQIAQQDREDPLYQSLLRSRGSFASKRHDGPHTLRRAAISFRFVGDAYDKWWSCYTLSYIPGCDEWFDINQYTYKDRADEKKRDQEDLHGQRRLIELFLLENMTKAALSSTDFILQFIDEFLDQGQSASGGADNDSDEFDREFDVHKSHALSSEYVRFSKLLRRVEDDRNEMMKTIVEWNERGKQRKDQPRWSLRDEIEYRKPLDLEIQKLKRNITKMTEQGDKIKRKLEDLKDDRAILSADLSLREARVATQSSEDVRLFTYVTIIFLPLSFSSSLFGMQALPENTVINTFVILTTCALCITFFVLVNLRTISRTSGKVATKMLMELRKKMNTSLNDFWRGMARELETAEQQTIHQYGSTVSERNLLKLGKPIDQPDLTNVVLKAPSPRAPSPRAPCHQGPCHQSKWWYLNFWLSYILLQVPAQRVAFAWQVFDLSKEQRKGLGSPRLAVRIIVGLLLLPVLIPSHILWFIIINLLDLPPLLYWQLSRGLHLFSEWLDAELPSEPQSTSHDVSAQTEHRDSISRNQGRSSEQTERRDSVTRDQGRSTSVDSGVKLAASLRGRVEPPLLEANKKRIQALSEPWKISRAHAKWFKPKEGATASESKAPIENNEGHDADGRAEGPKDDRETDKRNRGKWSYVLNLVVSLLRSGRGKESQPEEAKDGHKEGV